MTSQLASATASAESSSPYRRDNWWYNETGHPGHEEDDQEDGPHSTRQGTSRIEWIAQRLLRATAPLTCPVAANENPQSDSRSTTRKP